MKLLTYSNAFPQKCENNELKLITNVDLNEILCAYI